MLIKQSTTKETTSQILCRKFQNEYRFEASYEKPYDICYHDLYNDLFYKNYVFRNNLSNGYYVEIGALDGVKNSQSFLFEKELNWNGIVVEPNPIWFDELKMHRTCNISKLAISNKNGNELFECREIYGFSGLKSNTSDTRMSNIENEITVETTTLIDLLDLYNAPEIVDWVAIDTEGGEYDILSHYFDNNKKYKINLINFESGDYEHKTIKLFNSEPYLKIKNPYLEFLRMTNRDGLVKFESVTGQFCKGYDINITDIDLDGFKEVNFEHYYVHIDYLKNNLHLKKFLI